MIKVTVLGPGCFNCEKLADMCKQVLQENELEGSVKKITDINQITAMGVMMTPGLMINDELKSSGKVPGKGEILNWFLKASAS
ncbi:MAG: thioredoxin family protein [FCB group bacterium]|nr:thioredoxin family protein [FCB group bacterium]